MSPFGRYCCKSRRHVLRTQQKNKNGALHEKIMQDELTSFIKIARLDAQNTFATVSAKSELSSVPMRDVVICPVLQKRCPADVHSD